MKELIESIGKQVQEAIQIGSSAKLNTSDKRFNSVLVCGLGGSGIGGKIISLLVNEEIKVPFILSNDYNIPACIDNKTLLIASSYSGNTEETLAAVREGNKRGAEIVVITSGGELLELALSNGWNHLVVPKGQQPRAMLVYSLVQQLFILQDYKLISDKELTNLADVVSFLESEKNQVQDEAMRIAKHLHMKTPVIYSGSYFEGIAIRFRQQLNENAKMLCWNHVLPEMTHNELVGWAGGNDTISVVYLKTDFDHPRTNYRWEISKDIIAKKTPHVTEIRAKGKNRLAQNFYLIHLTDWVSYYLSELKKIDAVEVNVINHLKTEMSKHK
ncbi:MAG: bifunctional phosphoglucose/phosphomannose isomerase [Crocinitomicaceae bacterium]|nr:bifunctional phosphoglucose/phosphomannose isomerase [Crocinitomicaceae bacterium]